MVSYISKATPIKPDNAYALSKYLAEEAVRIFVKRYSILRIAGIYGLDGPTHLGLNVAIGNALYKKIPPILKGPGKAKRNYICVDDVARWIAHLVKQYEQHRYAPQETIYIAGKETLTVEEYLQMVAEILVPGKQLMYKAGEEADDCVIAASPAPFTLRSFRQYLNSLVSMVQTD
mgnify:FL=1